MYNLSFKDNFSYINTIDDLANFLEVPGHVLARCANASSQFYREFKIPKRNGEFRTIQSASPTMRAVQVRIKSRIIDTISISDYAHGYAKDRSIVSNAASHKNSNSFAKMDIKDFFPSVKISHIFSIFQALSIGIEASKILSLICTKDGFLPQGASTSPPLSNVFMIHFDSRISEFAKELDLKYTRYVDDIVLSGNTIPLSAPKFVSDILLDGGLKLNESKTIIARNVRNFKITGVSISDGKLFLPRESKRRIRLISHFLLKNGILAESSRDMAFDPLYVDRVQGKLSFWLQVEPDNAFAKSMKHRISALEADLSSLAERELGRR